MDMTQKEGRGGLSRNEKRHTAYKTFNEGEYGPFNPEGVREVTLTKSTAFKPVDKPALEGLEGAGGGGGRGRGVGRRATVGVYCCALNCLAFIAYHCQ